MSKSNSRTAHHRPFRVLWIDDQTAGDIANEGLASVLEHVSGNSRALLVKLLHDMTGAGRMQVYLSEDAVFASADTVHALSDCEVWSSELADDPRNFDFVILDIKGFDVRRSWKIEEGDLAPPVFDGDVEALNSEYPGAAYYLKWRMRLRNVAVLSQFDTGRKDTLDGPLARHLATFASTDPGGDRKLLMQPKTREGMIAVAAYVRRTYEAFTTGHTFVGQLDAIELAAIHDEPVLILGETGTGKEEVAQAIHRRWSEKRSSEQLGWQVVNCAGLSAELARAELFGYVRGAYTGADSHQIGAILAACGCRRIAARRATTQRNRLRTNLDPLNALVSALGSCTEPGIPDGERLRRVQKNLIPYLREQFETGTADVFSYLTLLRQELEQSIETRDYVTEFEEQLLAKNQNLLSRGDDGSIVFDEPWRAKGTLFLDEFGDLAPEVQALLLRYLGSNREVQPLGYPGRIVGANVRIIAATSDPDVAQLVGQKLTSWRAPRERPRDIRDDLVFRVKGQIIRVAPVSSDNVTEVVNHFVTRDAEVRWHPHAIEHLEGQIRALLEADRSDSGRAAFGHYREIDRIVTLAGVYVRNAQQLGFRAADAVVTAEVVDAVWRPSVVHSFARSVATKGADRIAPSSSPWDFEKLCSAAQLSPGQQTYCVLKCLMRSPGTVFDRESLAAMANAEAPDSPVKADSIAQVMYLLRRRVNPFTDTSHIEVLPRKTYGVRILGAAEDATRSVVEGIVLDTSS